jgi:hypothetical protein
MESEQMYGDKGEVPDGSIYSIGVADINVKEQMLRLFQNYQRSSYRC